MTALIRPVGGASAYSSVDYSAYQPLDQLALYSPATQQKSTRGWPAMIDELLRIRAYEDDWDGDGVEAPHPTLVDGAITLAKTLQARQVAPPDRVHASVNSTVYFEWHSALGYVEIEVVSPTEAECRWLRNGSGKAEVAYLSR